MARTIPTSPLTPADELRHLLDVSEKRAVNIKGAGADAAAELLQWLDHIYRLLPELEAAGGDLRPEQVRWQTLQGSVQRHAHELQAELGPAGGLAACRQAQPTPPSAEQWWWWLDAYDRQKRLQTLRKLVLTGVIAAILLWGGRLALHRFFPVDPQVVQSMELRNQGDRWLADGDMEQAIASYEAALAVRPNDTDTQIWLAAMYTVHGQEAKATPLLQALINELGASQVHASLGQVLIQLNHAASAVPLAQQAIAEDPQNPNAYLTLGSAYEALQEYQRAADQFAQAATIAEQSNQAELIAIARIRMAQMLQRIPLQNTLPTPSS